MPLYILEHIKENVIIRGLAEIFSQTDNSLNITSRLARQQSLPFFPTSIPVNSPAVHRRPYNLASSLFDSCDFSCCWNLQKLRESHLLLPWIFKFPKARPS